MSNSMYLKTVAVVVMLCAISLAADPNQQTAAIKAKEITLERLAQICETMESSFKSIHLKYECYATPAHEVNEIAGTGFLMAKGHQRYELLTARPFRDHVRLYEWITFVNSDGNSWDSFSQSTFNGTNSVHFSFGGFPKAVKDGEICQGKRYVPESMNLTPLGFSVLHSGLGDGSDTQTLSAVLRDLKDSIALDTSISRINGFDCIKIELLSLFRNKPIRRIYFSVAHGYTPVRFEDLNGSKVTHSLSVTSLQQVSSNLWFPVAGMNESPQEKRSNIYRATEPALINMQVSDKDFELEFPAGTRVLDTIKNTTYYVKPTKEQENETNSINEYMATAKLDQKEGEEGFSIAKLHRLALCKDFYIEREKKMPQSISDVNSCLDKDALAWCLENVEYLGKGMSRSEPSDTPIAYDRTLLQKNGRAAVLFMNGIVRLLTISELKNLGVSISADINSVPARQRKTCF